MYRSNIENSFNSENKENTNESHSQIIDNDSISEMFKKMTINDRKSANFSSNNTIEDGFMTSSPINKHLKLIKPIFNKIEPSSSSNVEIVPQVEDNEQIKRSQTMKLQQKPPLNSNRVYGENKKPFNVNTNIALKNNSINRSNVSLMSNKVTIPKPFSFETKDKALVENRKKMMENDILEKKRLASAFKANPMPISSPVFFERKLTKSSTSVLKSFNNDKSRLKVITSNNSFNTQGMNTTKDLSYLHRSPLKLKPSTAALTCPETPKLILPLRLERRKLFDENQLARGEKILKLKEMYDEENLKKEKIEIKQLRCENVIKANPIKTFKNVKIEHNPKTTVPSTPKFSDRFKK